MNLKSLLTHIESFLGGLKFAVIIMASFILAMIWGTFTESWHGTEYASALIYKSPLFLLLLLFLFISIFMAALLRLPLQKRLYGFYTVHLGLLILLTGSFLTFIIGIDGTLILNPESFQKEVQLSSYNLAIYYENQGKKIKYALPHITHPKYLGKSYDAFTLLDFIPYAKEETIFGPSPDGGTSEYQLRNAQFTQSVLLSLASNSDFPATTQMGPLGLHYLPPSLFSCLEKTKTWFFLWDQEKQDCLNPSFQEKGEQVHFQIQGKTIIFNPLRSPLPLSQEGASSLRLFNKRIFEKSPHILLFGKAVAFFNKNTQKWETHSFQNTPSIALPWMGFELSLKQHHPAKTAQILPVSTKPIHENGNIILGDMKALQLAFQGEKYWVTSKKDLPLFLNNEKILLRLEKETLTLPYEIKLDKFHMEKDPGTETPASFESFVTLRAFGKESTHHIFMNNPLKFSGMTFYQASYFPVPELNSYGSVLSVNYDPGRILKYLGALLIVLGAIWHYRITKRKKSF
ncbi:MAG: cytochrome c biogenesis protein ResB [Bacteriovoracaceae bacterium]|nr:cytochrome c biogenesis protein ResB [Bacteriovoracaceae bacterium]